MFIPLVSARATRDPLRWHDAGRYSPIGPNRHCWAIVTQAQSGQVRDEARVIRCCVTAPSSVIPLLAEGLALDPGVTYLIGENGSGKSTLLEAMAVVSRLGSRKRLVELRLPHSRLALTVSRGCALGARRAPASHRLSSCAPRACSPRSPMRTPRRFASPKGSWPTESAALPSFSLTDGGPLFAVRAGEGPWGLLGWSPRARFARRRAADRWLARIGTRISSATASGPSITRPLRTEKDWSRAVTLPAQSQA